MKTITFPAFCRFGKLYSGESDVEVELTDEEYDRIMKYGTNADIYYNEFPNCKELKDLYDKIYTIAVDQMTQEMREYGDLEEKYANDPDWKVDDTYYCGVHFPFEFEDILVEDS